MKLLRLSLAAASVLWLCACTVAQSPTEPDGIATADALVASGDFDSTFYRAFLQNGYEAPDRLEPIRLLRGPLRVYVRTVDDAGRAIDAATLEMTEKTLMQSAWIWSGETFGVVEVARGTATREHLPGWITVKWTSAAPGNACGRSTVGRDGGFIELNASGSCRCGLETAVYPRLIRHELGHAMGYYHTDDVADVMYGNAITSRACNVDASDRERRHAKFAHGAM